MLASSTVYLHWPLTSDSDLSLDTISVSFDRGATWHVAEHEPGGIRVLIGPGGVAQPVGLVRPQVKIGDSPEVPVLDGGSFYVSVD